MPPVVSQGLAGGTETTGSAVYRDATAKFPVNLTALRQLKLIS